MMTLEYLKNRAEKRLSAKQITIICDYLRSIVTDDNIFYDEAELSSAILGTVSQMVQSTDRKVLKNVLIKAFPEANVGILGIEDIESPIIKALAKALWSLC